MKNIVFRILAACALLFGLTSSAWADDLSDARALIGAQLDMIKKGDVNGLKPGFTKRLQDKVNEANVKAAQKEAEKFTVNDLVEKIEPKGKDSIKVKMKGGRTLTTLVKVDGKWQADTIWFK